MACSGIMPCTLMKSGFTDIWTQTIDVNLNGVLHSVGAVLPGMLELKVNLFYVSLASHFLSPSERPCRVHLFQCRQEGV